MSDVTHMKKLRVTHEWDMLHIWMSHLSHMNVRWSYAYAQYPSCPMSHIWMSHMSHVWMTHMSHIWVSHVICVNQITSHIHKSHVPLMNESCHTRECSWCATRALIMCACSCHTNDRVMSHIWVSRVSHINATRALILCVCSWHDTCSIMCVTYFFYMCDITHSYARHDSCMCDMMHMLNEPCHTYERAMSRVWMSHVTRMNESCGTYEWVMSHTWVTSVAHMNESCHTHESHLSHERRWCATRVLIVCAQWVMSFIKMSHVTRITESCYTYEWVMSHVWLSHIIRMNESCLSYECRWCAMRALILCVCSTSHVTYMNESCHSY